MIRRIQGQGGAYLNQDDIIDTLTKMAELINIEAEKVEIDAIRGRLESSVDTISVVKDLMLRADQVK